MVGPAPSTDVDITYHDGTSSLPEPSVHAASTEEKNDWQGFAELENDPAYFNVLLREWGMTSAAVQEIWAMDPDSLANLP